MAAIQAADEIGAICARLHGRRIALLQVLGINALKSMQPGPNDLVDDMIVGSEVSDRIVKLHTKAHSITVDLQRTGKVVWLSSPEPYRMAPGGMPTARLITDQGGLDLTEPAKTKRITVAVAVRAE